jgi:hypothetical protein
MRRALLLLLTVHLAGCSSWQVQPIAPARLIEAERPDRVFLTLHDGREVIVASPRMDGDSIHGEVQLGPDRAFHTSEVDQIAVREEDDRSGGIGVMAGALGLIVIAGLVCFVGTCW